MGTEEEEGDDNHRLKNAKTDEWEEGESEIDKILKQRVNKEGETEYLIKWVGWDDASTNWQTLDEDHEEVISYKVRHEKEMKEKLVKRLDRKKKEEESQGKFKTTNRSDQLYRDLYQVKYDAAVASNRGKPPSLKVLNRIEQESIIEAAVAVSK